MLYIHICSEVYILSPHSLTSYSLSSLLYVIDLNSVALERGLTLYPSVSLHSRHHRTPGDIYPHSDTDLLLSTRQEEETISFFLHTTLSL